MTTIESHPRSHEHVAESTVTRLRQVLMPDVQLYEHFSKKLLERLDAMPHGFQDKLRGAKEAKKEVSIYLNEIVSSHLSFKLGKFQ